MSERITKAHYAYTGRLLKLRLARVRLPNGVETTREIVEHPGAVAVLPILDRNRILVTKQYRMAARRQLVEIPAGTLERDESPRSCAKRELIEETGYTAKDMRKVFSCYLAPGYSTEKIHFFVASKLVPSKVAQVEDEVIAVQAMDLHEGLMAIETGEIQDAKTICGLYYLATHRRPKRRRSRLRSTIA